MFTVVKIKRQRSFITIWSGAVGRKDIKGKRDFFHYIKIEHLGQQDSTPIRLFPLIDDATDCTNKTPFFLTT